MTQVTSNSVEITRGPSGRAVSEPMDNSLVEALYEHITIERNASSQYFALSLWFAERELRGFSKFFEKESIEEQKHASKFAKYLIARGQTVLLENLPSPQQDHKSILDIVTQTFQLEADVTTSLQQLYSIAERSSDTRTTVFLDPIIENQISSEDDSAYLLGKVKFSNEQPSALLIIDSELYEGNLNK